MSENGIILSYTDIVKLIPHRPPFLMVDRIQDIVPRERARGIKVISSNEPHLAGHFPGLPITPGVLLVEGMAQTALALIGYSKNEDFEGRYVYLTTIDKAKFRGPARPGDTVHFDVKFVNSKDLFYKFEGVASIDGKVIASALFSAMGVEAER
jgi:3-hydroxyacyl-[acyl-carrier-protein] dehydratase